jgi:hypothetical protein
VPAAVREVKSGPAGYLTADDAHAWLEHLTTGTFFATTSFITVLAQSTM